MSIDHKAAADSYLEACVYDTHAMTNAEKVSLAQVHATLYLAEQQRIANLITTAGLNYGAVDFTRPWEGMQDTDRWRAIRADVAEGLGLS
ncbi:hypothetical protein [Glaciibacter psychrotolerans]|uniref:Uncharacterized protein n=1 Tax=Glaciibacter psychrotolerans TaxID=670054 RepID=A0A7Z0J598_9MICO|nr:hypothetical protein [Leifsonia psychrotolerans]NYJ19160.1 hypothetical protein [Leifsonia psychrotolerans]